MLPRHGGPCKFWIESHLIFLTKPLHQIERAHERFGFEWLILAVGSVINQDQGLARMSSTENMGDVRLVLSLIESNNDAYECSFSLR